MEAFREVGIKKEDLRSGFAAALNEQGRFAPTRVGDFEFVPVAGRHVWKGRVVNTPAELAECVNGAMKSIIDFRDPFQSLEVVAVATNAENLKTETLKPTAEIGEEPTEASTIWALIEANWELREALERVEIRTAQEARALA